MKTSKKRDLVISVLLLAVFAALSPKARAAGSLEPSAPPGPVMKSLDEVEPRTPIKPADLPLTITQSGSYYLTGDVNFTDTAHNAITVDCNDVTIDLKGYSIAGPNATNFSGIYINARTNIEIINGTLRDFYCGVRFYQTANKGHRVINIRAVSCTAGFYLYGCGHLIKDCSAQDNWSSGIYVDAGCTVTGNTASCNGYNGIQASTGCLITGNTIYSNSSFGIYADGGCKVSGNTSYLNGSGIGLNYGCEATGNTVTYNGSSGIDIGSSCTVTGNIISHNTGNGIKVQYSKNAIMDNKCFYNGYNVADAAGIYIQSGNGYGNRIEGNHVCSNDRGIDVDCANNLIVKNSASGNTVEYDIVAGNKVGTISTDPTTAGAWDNFDF
jgi:parallel beta-helix repeat protein